MSMNVPVAPSARNQFVAGAVTPALSWPMPKNCPGRSRYSARSAMIGTPLVERMTTDMSVAASPASAGSMVASLLTQMLKRDCATTVYTFVSGAAGGGRR